MTSALLRDFWRYKLNNMIMNMPVLNSASVDQFGTALFVDLISSKTTTTIFAKLVYWILLAHVDTIYNIFLDFRK